MTLHKDGSLAVRLGKEGEKKKKKAFTTRGTRILVPIQELT